MRWLSERPPGGRLLPLLPGLLQVHLPNDLPAQTSRRMAPGPPAAVPLLFRHARYVRGADLSRLQASTFNSSTAGKRHAAMWNSLLFAAQTMQPTF